MYQISEIDVSYFFRQSSAMARLKIQLSWQLNVRENMKFTDTSHSKSYRWNTRVRQSLERIEPSCSGPNSVHILETISVNTWLE